MSIPKLFGVLAGVLLTTALLLSSCGTAAPVGGTPVPGSTGTATPAANPGAEAAQRATEALATELSLDPADVTVVKVEAVQWPDSCLGIHLPGQACAMHVVEGYKVRLEAQKLRYEYRTNADGSMAVPALALTWHREGGVAGFCDDLVIDQTGLAQAFTCKSGLPQDSGQMRLDDGQLQQLQGWLADLTTFQFEQSDPATADAMTVRVSFEGLGSRTATETDQEDIAAFAATLYPQVSRDQSASAMAEPDQVVQDFLNTLHEEPSGQKSLEFLGQSLLAVIENGQSLTDLLGIEPRYRSFGIVSSQLEDGGRRALVEVGLNMVSPVNRAFQLSQQGGLWRIDTIIVYGLPSMTVPAGVVAADQVLLGYVQALQDHQPVVARAFLSSEAQARTSEAAMGQLVAAINWVAAPSVKLIQASSDRVVYEVTLWVEPAPGAADGWVAGSNPRWLVLTKGAQGWTIAQISDSPVS